MSEELQFLYADWPAPPSIRALTSLRDGGVSTGPYAGANFGAHCGDTQEAVASNRRELCLRLQLKREPLWLQQVHGVGTVRACDENRLAKADASWTTDTGMACAILTADCLPVLFCDRRGEWLAAAHAGWRGLAAGVLESVLATYKGEPDELMAWMGPAISAPAFEVGQEVFDSFVGTNPEDGAGFNSTAKGKYHADLYWLARQRLQRAGLSAIYGGGHCTFGESDRFYSYRRDAQTGRMASLIWRDEPS